MEEVPGREPSLSDRRIADLCLWSIEAHSGRLVHLPPESRQTPIPTPRLFLAVVSYMRPGLTVVLKPARPDVPDGRYRFGVYYRQDPKGAIERDPILRRVLAAAKATGRPRAGRPMDQERGRLYDRFAKWSGRGVHRLLLERARAEIGLRLSEERASMEVLRLMAGGAVGPTARTARWQRPGHRLDLPDCGEIGENVVGAGGLTPDEARRLGTRRASRELLNVLSMFLLVRNRLELEFDHGQLEVVVRAYVRLKRGDFDNLGSERDRVRAAGINSVGEQTDLWNESVKSPTDQLLKSLADSGMTGEAAAMREWCGDNLLWEFLRVWVLRHAEKASRARDGLLLYTSK